MLSFDSIALILLGFLIALQSKFVIGLLSGAVVLAWDSEDDSKMKNVYAIVGVAGALPLLAYVLIPHVAERCGIATTGSMIYLVLWGLCVAASYAFAFWWLRVGVQKADEFTARITKKTSLERNKKTDVREIQKFLPKASAKFNPVDFMDMDKGVFLGKDEDGKPVYLSMLTDMPEGKAPHVDVIGTTGAGKGIVLGVMASQFMQRDEAVFFCDPKNDEWAPSVLYAQAKRMGKPYHFINLNRPNGAQFNILEGATTDELFELFQAGFGLIEKGDSSDFYGIDDRRHARLVADLVAEKKLTFAEAFSEAEAALFDEKTGAKKFGGKLREMAEVPAINAKSGGVSLEQIVADGGCVYVIGSMRNDIIRTVQKILLVRLIQLAERRDRMAGPSRRVCVILDEVKYHLSKPALEALGAARDKGMHLIMAHQSLGDLKDCTKDMSPDAVVEAFVENCKVKICYQVQNPDTALWLADMSGDIQVDDESRNIYKNVAQAETVEGKRSIRQTERSFIDKNMLLNLPPQVAVVYGLLQPDGTRLPKFVNIQPLKVPKAPESVKIKTVDGVVLTSIVKAFAEVDDGKNPFDLGAEAESFSGVEAE